MFPRGSGAPVGGSAIAIILARHTTTVLYRAHYQPALRISLPLNLSPLSYSHTVRTRIAGSDIPLTFEHMTIVSQPHCQETSASRLFEQYSLQYDLC